MKSSRFLQPFLWLFGMFFCLQVSAQQVRGLVISGEDQLPVIGASVSVKNTSQGVVTDEQGRYSIDAASADAILVFSYIGLQEQEIAVNGQSEINVTLNPALSLLNEVVVVGYGTQKRSEISGAVSTLDASDITESPILRVEQALQGRVAGVQVSQNSGSPGSPLTVRIRGTGTINNSDPLYIVDGIPVAGLDFINPNDIESINVLKDAASATIYGARGANGVVLIKTISGKAGAEGVINYHTYYGVQRPWKNLNMLNAREYAILSNEAHIAAGRTPLPEFAYPDALGEGTDWMDAIFQTDAPMASHQLSMTGGSAKSTYALSGNYFTQDGIVGGDKSGFDRITARLNTTHQIKKWLSVGNTFNYTNLKRRFLPENNEFTTPVMKAMNLDPVTPIRKPDGTYAYSQYTDTDITNPLNQIETTFDKWKTNRMVGSVFAELQLAPGLKFRSTYSLDNTFARRDIFYPRFDLSVDPVLSDAPAAEKRLINSVVVQNHNWRNWQWENVATYNMAYRKDHHFNFVLGTSALYNRYDYSAGGNSNLPSNDPDDAYINNTIDPIASQTSSSGADESSLLSYFGRVNYDFNSKYLFSASLRADGSSRFGANNRFGIFSAFSGGWVFSKEAFFDVEQISFAKLRASWGQNGNDNIGNYAFTSVVYSGQNYTFGPDETITNGSVALAASNPDIKWETNTQTDIGLDLELYEGRVALTTDYFIKKTSDMLYAVPVLATAGTEPPVQNVASAVNKGWELALNYRNKDYKVQYSVGANITFIKNEVTDLGSGGKPVLSGSVQSTGTQVARTDVGHPLASFYGYVTDGIFQTEQEVADHAFQNEATAPGDIRFKDLNGDGQITELDQDYIGSPIPKFTYGFTGDVSFMGFDLSMFWQGSAGNDIYNGTVRYDFIYVNRPESVLDRWTGPGTSNDEPRVTLTDLNRNARVSDRFIEDGSYFRLKNLQIGYSLPKKLTQRWHLSNLRVYVSGQNLLTFTQYSGLDPEIGQIGGSLELGIDKGFYPQAKAFLAGVNVTF